MKGWKTQVAQDVDLKVRLGAHLKILRSGGRGTEYRLHHEAERNGFESWTFFL
jgi:hypothetical protein